MRRPTTADDAMAYHRAAQRGGRPPVFADDPQPGFYWLRRHKGGPRVPVEIRLIQDIDPETGELASDEWCAAIVGPAGAHSVVRAQDEVESVWMSCANKALSRSEYFALCEISTEARAA